METADLSVFERTMAVVMPSTPADFWAMVAAACTIALIVLAVKGLKSLRIAQSDVELRCAREAIAVAITRCEEMAGLIIPTTTEMLAMFKAENVPTFVTNPNQVLFDPDNDMLLKDAKIWVGNLSPQLLQIVGRQMNMIEGWATYFTSGLADHRVAYGSCATVFCQQVVRLYGFLLAIRNSPSSGKFPCTVQLFLSWNSLLEEEKRGLLADDLLRKLDELTENAPSNPPYYQLPEPLGSRLDARRAAR